MSSQGGGLFVSCLGGRFSEGRTHLQRQQTPPLPHLRANPGKQHKRKGAPRALSPRLVPHKSITCGPCEEVERLRGRHGCFFSLWQHLRSSFFRRNEMCCAAVAVANLHLNAREPQFASHGKPASPWARRDLTGHVMHK